MTNSAYVKNTGVDLLYKLVFCATLDRFACLPRFGTSFLKQNLLSSDIIHVYA